MKIRILYTQETIGSGGVERRRLSLIKSLDKNLYEIKIVCTKIEGSLADEMRAEGVEVIKIGLLDKIWRLDRYKSVLQVIRRYKPHIIHGAVFEGVLLATISGFIGRVPIIIAEETSDPVNRTSKATLLLKLLSIVSDKFVGVSPAAYNYLLTVAKLNREKVQLIVNGVATPPEVDDASLKELKSSLGLKEQDIVIGSVGRLFNDVKLFTDLIKAVSILRDKHPNLKLLIVGDGPDKEYIVNDAIMRGVRENVIMAGYQYNPHPFFKLMDIFTLVSSTESFGLAAVEAMYHKLPVVASRVGGLAGIIKHNETGLLVDPHSPDQIAKALETLISDRRLITRMGEKGYERAKEKYSAERYVKDVEKLYDELLRQKQII